ncbi:MAG: hypothetical protein AAFR82_02845 [Pseudomonadota bacterium]
MYIAQVILSAGLVLIVNRVFGSVLKKSVKDNQRRKMLGLMMGAAVGILLALASLIDVFYAIGVYVPATVLAWFILSAREKKAAKKANAV